MAQETRTETPHLSDIDDREIRHYKRVRTDHYVWSVEYGEDDSLTLSREEATA